jgi:hypothetical protein
MEIDSEINYEIVPVNNSCKNQVHNDVTISAPGSQTSYSNQNITDVTKQTDANAQYDNVDNITVKPLYGGILEKKNNKIINKNLSLLKSSYSKINIKENLLFTIKFRNKIVKIQSLDEKSAIKIFLNNKIYKKDHLLEIIYKNKSSIYIIKNGYKNKFIKIN